MFVHELYVLVCPNMGFWASTAFLGLSHAKCVFFRRVKLYYTGVSSRRYFLSR